MRIFAVYFKHNTLLLAARVSHRIFIPIIESAVIVAFDHEALLHDDQKIE
jgi:hypothetical protein